MTASCDVAIVGGGPAGSATALALRGHGVPRIVVLEAGCFDQPRIGESVPPDTRIVLGQLGLWDSFLAEDHAPCHGSCAAWGDDHLRHNEFLFNPHGSGFHLDRVRFDRWLARSAEAAGAELWTAARLRTVERTAGGLVLGLEHRGHPAAVTARFVVDATGRRACLARLLGARRQIDDRMTFLYGFFAAECAAGDSSLTLLEAAPYGWWYAARLPGGRTVIALASDPDAIRGARLHDPDVWGAYLAATRHVRGLLAPDAALAAPLVACEASSACLSAVCGPDWFAVGDAAAAFDPLSSQGIHKALGDGIRSADAIATHLSGSAGALDGYAAFAARRFDRYRRERARFYADERRWPDAPFWTRRRATGAPRMPAAALNPPC